MVVVRESPRAKQSPDKNAAQWPPKSPFQALLSSPSGRKKWQDHRTRGGERTPSPSPLRRPMSSSKALQAVSMGSDDDDEDEDEETLRLKMEMIATKLKMKALRRKKLAGGDEGKEDSSRTSSRADSIRTSPRKSLHPSTSQPNLRRPAAEVEVPLSPAKDRIAEPVSPARKRLGLKAPAKAQDVSLKRARDGTQVNRADSVRSALSYEAPKPKSFSERLQASKQQTDEREAKFERIERTRSKGFGGNGTTVHDSRRENGTVGTSGASVERVAKRPSSARETQNSSRPSKDASISQSASTRSSQSTSRAKPTASALFQTAGKSQSRTARASADSDSDLSIAPPTAEDTPSSSYDPISEIHLTKRHIPHSVVAREMEGKELYDLPRLLKEVKSPHYDPPDCEEDFVVFAVLASKTSPYDQKPKHKTSDMDKPQEDAEAPRNKFMVLKLTDLKYEVDCFLFGTAFDQFWKLTPGTLLAILNPAILPPKTNQHSGRFSLKLGSSEDCVMELGIARDLGYCSSVKKDGQQCGEWIDKRAADICDFHLNLFVEKQRKGRMEVNTMWRGTGGDPKFRIKSQSREAGGFDKDIKRQKGITQSREYGTLYSVPTGMKNSAASLLDAEDMDALHNMTTEEASRKRIAAAQKERDLAKRLGEIGNSVGAEYMQAKTGATATSSSTSRSTRSRDIGAADARALFEKPKASELGLLDNKATATHLSPAKDRKHHFGIGAVGSSGRGAMGWGGAREYGLLQPKNTGRLGSPERGQTKLDTTTAKLVSAVRPPAVRARSTEDGSLSPTKKRARFMLDKKGIREPGRESGGQDLWRGPLADDEDEDGLDIV
ncbi:hypothetical protein LTR36_006599 [Oleoguttula mirabilis]|uniref:Zinc finger Mcm10/DnaG-type domain-containing protein n=1 Tax=Oleoguttula mirabilis TaxID=1507867 RepID=A0AAV9JCQ2_9PEZI|nr:hypothetical protein LTR36_006599 [Oleoguttula mirabilis]